MKKLTLTLVIGTALLVPSTSFAVGNYRFCGKWTYQFDDEGHGEDYLLHNAGSVGRIAAARTWADIHRNGASVWSGYMDDNGCTGTITAQAGDYDFWVTTAVAKSGKHIWIWPNDTENWQWFSATYDLSQLPTGHTETRTTSFGFGEQTASVAAVAVHLINQPAQGLVNNTYKVYANQDCPGGGFAGCFTGSAVYLGDDNFGNFEAFNKTVIAHELGHYVQQKLFGPLALDYSLDGGSTYPMCSCDHVVTANQAHCIQSREHMSTAEIEGWAQFYAADLYNNGAQSTAGFAYYKEVNVFGSTLAPPVQIDMAHPHIWMQLFCMPPFGQTGLGTELDWSTFYWNLNNKTSSAFSYGDLEDIYEEACGGSCFGDDVQWLPLAIAVDSLYGPSSAKALHFNDTGEAHGVIHL